MEKAHRIQTAKKMERQGSSRPRRGRPALRQPIRYCDTASPSPPRSFDYEAHEEMGVPQVNFGVYWKKRHDLIQDYKREVGQLQDFYQQKMAEAFWKYKFQSLQLTAQRDFNTELIRWKETPSEPRGRTAATQTIPEQAQTNRPGIVVTPAHPIGSLSIVPIPPRPVLVRRPTQPTQPTLQVPVSTSACNTTPARAMPILQAQPPTPSSSSTHPQPVSNQPTAQEQPEPSTSGTTLSIKQERRERQQRKRSWKREHPNWSFNEAYYSSSGSDTEPL